MHEQFLLGRLLLAQGLLLATLVLLRAAAAVACLASYSSLHAQVLLLAAFFHFSLFCFRPNSRSLSRSSFFVVVLTPLPCVLPLLASLHPCVVDPSSLPCVLDSLFIRFSVPWSLSAVACYSLSLSSSVVVLTPLSTCVLPLLASLPTLLSVTQGLLLAKVFLVLLLSSLLLSLAPLPCVLTLLASLPNLVSGLRAQVLLLATFLPFVPHSLSS